MAAPFDLDLGLDLGEDLDAMEVEGSAAEAAAPSPSPGAVAPGARGGLGVSSVGSSPSASSGSAGRRKVGLIYIDSARFCLGQVGSGKKGAFFCVRGRRCTVKSHRANRVDVPLGHLCIKAESGEKAFAHPRVSTADMDNQTLNSLLKDRRSVSEWLVRLKYVEREREQRRAVAEAQVYEDKKSEASDSMSIMPSRTLFKRLRMSEEKYFSPMKPAEWETMGEVDWDEDDPSLGEGPRLLNTDSPHIVGVAERVNELARASHTFSSTTKETIERVIEGVNSVGQLAQEVDEKVVRVDSKLGTLPEWVTDPDVVTIWSAIGETRELIDGILERVQDVEGERKRTHQDQTPPWPPFWRKPRKWTPN